MILEILYESRAPSSHSPALVRPRDIVHSPQKILVTYWSPEIVTVLPPLVPNQGKTRGVKRWLYAQNPQNFRRRFNQKTIGFIPPAGLLPPEAKKNWAFCTVLRRFCTQKRWFFNAKRRIQVPNPQNFRLRRSGFDRVTVLPPCSKIGKTRGVKR